MAHPFVSRLQEGPLHIDGAMGTMLYQGGAPLGEAFDALNLTSPELVSQVHRVYISAGADVVETNTFGANRAKLDAFGLGNKVREINRRGVKLAPEEREISGMPVLVAGAWDLPGGCWRRLERRIPRRWARCSRSRLKPCWKAGCDCSELGALVVGSVDDRDDR